ncbi:hypothetical protein [Streptomyces sp. NPDC002559]
MSADDIFKHILSWAAEDTHRGRLARCLRDNYLDSPELQAKRIGMLSIYLEREAKGAKGIQPIAV